MVLKRSQSLGLGLVRVLKVLHAIGNTKVSYNQQILKYQGYLTIIEKLIQAFFKESWALKVNAQILSTYGSWVVILYLYSP